MAAYRWMGPLRTSVRRAAVGLFRQLANSDDGRRVLRDALGGLTARGEYPPRDVSLPYPDLGSSTADAHVRPPIFITGRFRSGSTLLWNVFRQIPGCRAYYEPLNERRWFDPGARGTRIDRTHLGVDDYWREYEGLQSLGRSYQERWTHRRLYMAATDWDPDLHTYISALIQAAPGQPVLQFNRVDFRLPWLRAQFPTARLIHLFRHPRDQWCSSLVSPEAFPSTGTIAEFRDHDHFYLLPWAEDLSWWFPFLDPRSTDRPYELFYYLWRLSHAFGRHYAHASFSFESLCSSPDMELPRLLAASGVSNADVAALRKVIVPQRARWIGYAPPEWFAEQEERCESVLSKFFDAIPPGP